MGSVRILIFAWATVWTWAQPLPPAPQIRVTKVESTYRAAAGGLAGSLRTGQAADTMLSGLGFNKTGGGLLFNHPRSLASDGVRLVVSDGNNNRVLIWNTLPDGNVPPDVVLGQQDMDSNEPGRGKHQLNWPGQVSIGPGGQLAVADTYNDRLLIWRRFPWENGQPADVEIRTAALRWPWGVWTDGKRLVASSTGGKAVLFWNSLPVADNQAQDFVLQPEGVGTPRTIISDGKSLIVGEHNGFQTRVGNFFWKRFPGGPGDAPDFFASDPNDPNAGWLHGSFAEDGRLLMLGGRTLYVWNRFPEGEPLRADLSVRGYDFRAGDGGSAVLAGGRVYVLEYNGNKISVFHEVPARGDQRPDFAIGAPDLQTNTLLTEFFVTNAVPVSNGQSLFVSSDFDRRLVVWNELPDESGAKPNWVYELNFAPWDNEIWGETLVLAGQQNIAIWRKLPLHGEMPDMQLRQRIGNVRLDDVRGVALDGRYFYVAQPRENSIYVWRGIPDEGTDPAFRLEVRNVTRLMSDGEYLVAVTTEGAMITIFRVADLKEGAVGQTIGGPGLFNLPQGAMIRDGRLIVANTNFNRVMVWNHVEDAIGRRPADVLLGARNNDGAPELTQTGLFWPGVVSFDGSFLWVGEFKFSNRLMRYRVE